jgi:hypothetical protein
MKIRFVLGEVSVTATLDESGASRDLVSLLPLEIEMKDLFQREKTGTIPRTISEEGRRTFTCDVADVVYWPPGPHLAVFYAQSTRSLPQPGAIHLGTIDAGAEIFAAGSSVKAKIERAD